MSHSYLVGKPNDISVHYLYDRPYSPRWFMLKPLAEGVGGGIFVSG